MIMDWLLDRPKLLLTLLLLSVAGMFWYGSKQSPEKQKEMAQAFAAGLAIGAFAGSRH